MVSTCREPREGDRESGTGICVRGLRITEILAIGSRTEGSDDSYSTEAARPITGASTLGYLSVFNYMEPHYLRGN